MPISDNFLSLRPTLLGFAAVAAVSLSACGGGSSNDGNGGAIGGGDPPTLTTGTVAVLMTDAPTDAFCHIYARVESIDLLGTSGTPTNVFVGPETVDLLAMRNYTDFFAIDTAVPIGSYEKVRLTLSDLALVECDGTGNPEPEADWEHPRLPGNGKMDLNPRGMFEVIGGETLVIELDMDMNKSLHVHQTGNGRWQFRPVIFVTISPDDSKLVRVFGRVGDVGGNAFNLCPIEPASSTDDDGPAAGSECIEVVDLGGASIFDETGTPVGAGVIATDDLLTATGFLGLHDDSDGDSRMDDLRLDPVVIEIGPLGTFQRFRGAVVSALGNNDVFEFDSALLDPLAGVFDVLFQRNLPEGYESTRIYALGSNQPLTLAALQPGTEGEVSGVFTDPVTSGQPLKSSLIVLDQDTTPEVSIMGATISVIPADDDLVPETRRMTVTTAAQPAGRCVKTRATTSYLLITESATSTETTEIGFAALAVGNNVDVYGTTDPVESGCVLADTIQKYVPAAP
jgi:hypothetical protein